MKKVKGFVVLLFLVTAIAGCSLKLSSKKETFSANGLSYTLQLPSTWKAQEDFKEVYNSAAIFGAEDSNSESYMFVLAHDKKLMADQEFATKTREKLKTSYGYKKLEDVYLKEFAINKLPALKYTFFTTYKEKSVWAHLYYVEMENAVLQFIFYSADDDSYEDRGVIVDTSVKTIKESGVETKQSTTDSSQQTATENATAVVANADMKLTISGYRPTEDKQGAKYVAVRYDFANLAAAEVTSDVWYPLATATQNKEVLAPVSQLELDSEEMTNLQKMVQEPLAQNQSVEGIVFYKLVDQSTEDVILSFSQEHFAGQADIIFSIGGFKENE